MLEAILLGLEGSAAAHALRELPLLYPAVAVLHVVGVVILVGVAFVLDVRLLGRLRSLPIADAVHSLTRWSRWSVILVVPTGLSLFIADATTLAANPASSSSSLSSPRPALTPPFFTGSSSGRPTSTGTTHRGMAFAFHCLRDSSGASRSSSGSRCSPALTVGPIRVLDNP